MATAEYPVFRILAAKDSGITTVGDLKNVPIGISQGTVIEYMADRVLENAGLAPGEIAKIAVPKISDRTALGFRRAEGGSDAGSAGFAGDAAGCSTGD